MKYDKSDLQSFTGLVLAKAPTRPEGDGGGDGDPKGGNGGSGSPP